MSEIIWLGYLAAFLTSVGFVPQVIKSYRMRETRDLSLLMLLITAAGLALWLAYGLAVNEPALIAANSVSFPIAAILVAAKLRYG
jgi:MtN3 and saliva related transmembrane protein